jgi:hypothetical protein
VFFRGFRGKNKMKPRIIILLLLGLAVFLVWRLIRPMNIFIVSDAFESTLSTTGTPELFQTLHAEECGACHQDIYKEWQTTIHSQAWTDPYFQTDWQFDRSQHICKNCHIPLDRQQEHIVLGFRDKAKWDPILEPNPDFDPQLQHEGVTCAACHLRDGKIVGTLGIEDVPHPVKKIDDPNTVCVRCHVVEGDHWDTFFRFPPCGTVAEIKANPYSRLTRVDLETRLDSSGILPEAPVTIATETTSQPVYPQGKTGEITLPDKSSLGCVQCHMPLVERPLVEGGQVRQVRQHLWRGGHDPAMVKQGLEILFAAAEKQAGDERKFILTITNVGAAHYLPTGTPDRFLSVELRLLDREGKVLKEDRHNIKRTVMWRPFIIDLKDTRLPRWQPRSYEFTVPASGRSQPVAVEAVVRYHLLDERRRARINYTPDEPIDYEVFRQRVPL